MLPPGPWYLRRPYYQALGEIALASGDYQGALVRFRQSDVGMCVLCALPGLARTYDRAGDVDSARALYERYIETPYFNRLFEVDQIFLAPAYERLGQLYDQQGSPTEAAAYYGKFASLWRDADDELRPRVEAARQRLEALCVDVACLDVVEPLTGSLTVRVSQSGEDIDMNGFAIRVDMTEKSDVLWAADPLTKTTAGADPVTFSGLLAGPHTVALVDLWENCEVDGGAERDFAVVAGGTAMAAFHVTCKEQPPADVNVTGTWVGRWQTNEEGDALLELEQIGDDVVGTYELVRDDRRTNSLAGEVAGRVSRNSLTLYTDYEGAPGNFPGRRYWFLDVSGSEMAGRLGRDSSLDSYGTTTLTRQ